MELRGLPLLDDGPCVPLLPPRARRLVAATAATVPRGRARRARRASVGSGELHAAPVLLGFVARPRGATRRPVPPACPHAQLSGFSL